MASTARRSSSRRFPSQGQALNPAGSPCFGSSALDGGAAAGTGETWSAPAAPKSQQLPTSSDSSQNDRISSVRNRLRQMLQESSGSDSETWCNKAEAASASTPSAKACSHGRPSVPQAIPADVHEEPASRASAAGPSAVNGLGARRVIGRDVPAFVGARVAVLDARLARFVEPTGMIIETRCNGERVRVQHDGISQDFRYYNTGKDGEYQLFLADDSPPPPSGCLHFGRQSDSSFGQSMPSRHTPAQSSSSARLPDPPTPSSSSVQPATVQEPQQQLQGNGGQRRVRYSETRRISRMEREELIATPRADAIDDSRKQLPVEPVQAPATPVVKSKRYSELRRSASMPQDASMRDRPNPLLCGASSQNTPCSPAASCATPTATPTPRRYSAIRREKANFQAQEVAVTTPPQSRQRSCVDLLEQQLPPPPPPKEPKARQERASSFSAPEEAPERMEGSRRIHQLEETCEGLATQLKACEQALSREVAALREQMQREVQASEHRLLSKVQEEVNQTLHATLSKLLVGKRQEEQVKHPLGKDLLKKVMSDTHSGEEDSTGPVPSKAIRDPPPAGQQMTPRQREFSDGPHQSQQMNATQAPLEKARLDAEMARIADLRRFASGVLGLVGSEAGLNQMQPPQGDLYPSPFPRQPPDLLGGQPAAWAGGGPAAGCTPSMVDRSWPHPASLDIPSAGVAARPDKGRAACSRSRSTSEPMCSSIPPDVDGRLSMPQVAMQAMAAQCHGQTLGSNSRCAGSCLQSSSRPPPVPWASGDPGWEDHADRDGRIVF
mmetsp:Transcript_49587/g.91476  ORF Transcript_49587/g.91476 Transcript_49587/m.91476 type:complete len:782 (-) Transcript_49587:63-2408(-)